MLRSLGTPLIIFMVPFGLYVGYLVAQLVNPFEVSRWTRQVLIPLTLAGALLAVGSLVALGLLADRHEGGYRPAHIENGRIVPGQVQ